MKRNILSRTNALVSLILVVGFVLTALLSYRANYAASLRGIEQVSTLSSEGVYHQLTITFSRPVNVSLTMANDSLLKSLLQEEDASLEDPAYLARIREYLGAYRDKYGYDSVFLVSEASKRYYNFDGLDRVLTPDEPENTWYYTLGSFPEDYRVVVDNDEAAAADNDITVFVNAKIKGPGGAMLGAVGVGLRVTSLQRMLQTYQDQFGVNAYLIDGGGTIQISTDHTGYQPVSLFLLDRYGKEIQEQLSGWREADVSRSFWVKRADYVVARYLPELDWYLVVEQDTSALLRQLAGQFILTLAIIAAIIVTILLVITRVIRSFNRQIIALTQASEQERHSMFEQATEQLFDNIYELDITHDCPANRATERYFESLGAPPGTSYEKSLRIVAEKQIKEGFRQGYIDTFSPKNVQQAFDAGIDSLRYEFMMTDDGENYYWMRITARMVLLEGDHSLHMLTYRQNIDAEKRREERMRQLAQTDEMTGFLTKMATRRAIDLCLEEAPAHQRYAFFLFDIDNFKQANDLHGHAFGDSVILAFTDAIRAHFPPSAVLGRVGGDEFVAMVPVPDRRWAEEKARELADALDQVHGAGDKVWHATASIGVALSGQGQPGRLSLYENADAALYQTKARGKNGFTIYQA